MYHEPAASIPPRSRGTHQPFLSHVHTSRSLLLVQPASRSPAPAGVLSRRWKSVPPRLPLNSTAHRRKLRGSQPININDISIHRNNVANYGRPYYRGCLSLTHSLIHSFSLFPSPLFSPYSFFPLFVLPFFVSLTHLVGTGECDLLFDGNNYCQDLPRALRAGINGYEGEKRTEESMVRVVDGTYFTNVCNDIKN